MSKNLEFIPKISLCMIVKNEKQNLPRCLASVKPYVNEMIIVDTGSEDGTPEIAAEYGAKVSYFKWCDDFAAARNHSISQASGDWILVLDADEELVVESEDFFKQLNTNKQTLLYLFPRLEINDHSVQLIPSYISRLFRNQSDIKYLNRFHETPYYKNKRFSSDLVNKTDSIKLLHYGYNKSKVRQKDLNRNIPILERLQEEEGLSLGLLYCLAEMYRNTQQLEKSQEYYAEAFDKLLPNVIEGFPPEEFAFVPALIFTFGVQSLQQEDYETVRLLCQRGIEWCPNYPPVNYLAGATIRALGFPLGAVAYFENCLRLGKEGNYYNEPFETNYMTTYPAYDLGCVYVELERPQEALAAFELALSFDSNFAPAREKVDKIRQFLGSQT